MEKFKKDFVPDLKGILYFRNNLSLKIVLSPPPIYNLIFEVTKFHLLDVKTFDCEGPKNVYTTHHTFLPDYFNLELV